MGRADEEEGMVREVAIDDDRHDRNYAGPVRQSFVKRWFLKEALAEFVAMLLFVFVACSSAATNQSQGDLVNTTAVGLAHSFLLTCLIYAVANVSGGHLNPAVSLGALLLRKITLRQFFVYFFAQYAGAVAGSSLLLAALPEPVWSSPGDTLGGQTLSPITSIINGIVYEFLTTFLLMFVVVGTAMRPNGAGKHAPLAIGFAVAASIFASGPYTGGSLNPARTFGPLIARSFVHDPPADLWTNCWVFIVGPYAGAAMAALVGRITFF